MSEAQRLRVVNNDPKIHARDYTYNFNASNWNPQSLTVQKCSEMGQLRTSSNMINLEMRKYRLIGFGEKLTCTGNAKRFQNYHQPLLSGRDAEDNLISLKIEENGARIKARIMKTQQCFPTCHSRSFKPFTAMFFCSN